MSSQYVKLSPNDQNLLRAASCAVKSLNTILTTNSVIETGVLAPSLPYTIPDNVYHSFTIITTGAVELDGVLVPEGSYSYGANTGDLLTGFAITTSSSGTVVITTQKKL